MFDMTVSDWFGLAGSVLLLVAPARDQLGRFNMTRLRQHSARHAEATYKSLDLPTTSLQEMAAAVQIALERDHHRWRFSDSATMGLGAILLAVSFIL